MPADDAPRPRPDVAAVVAAGTAQARRGRWLAAGAVALLAGLALWAWLSLGGEPAPAYHTATVTRGVLQATVTATGTLEPVNQVDVGSELSGTIARVAVDDNDRVRRGQLLASLDLSRLEEEIARTRAALAAAEASVLQAAAGTAEAAATFERVRNLREAQPQALASTAELDAARAARDRAVASEAGARASVAQAQAGLRSALTNLGKARIRSPIDGVVLARRVEPGQTVAASLQAPVLFTLAENLAEMELQVDVSEADVGQVAEGQPATFRVDAYPQREYPARVMRVGLGPQLKDNVVSYVTVLRVANPDLSLRPGMTATAQITTLRREDALLVPNAALRFTPPEPEAPSPGLVARLMPRMPRSTTRRATAGAANAAQVWVLEDGALAEVPITTGATDGRVTEVVAGALAPGATVVTGVRAAAR